MTLIKYREYRFGDAVQQTIDQANAIIAEMQAQGYVLTLRQLYYQFVSRNWIPNTEREYKRLGRIVCQGREAGLISWTAIEDAGRNVWHGIGHQTPESVLNGIAAQLKLDPWIQQDTYLEVWVEKQALEGVIERPAGLMRVPYMACKGYLSASESWRAGGRFEEALRRGKRCVLLHLGDHDPSGIDMSRDNGDRLELFARQGVEVRRLALNMEQVEQYDPPPNPAKLTDSRANGYIDQFGDSSWELDALPPAVIDAIITDAIKEYVNQEAWDLTMSLEAEMRKPLAKLAGEWAEVKRLMGMEGKPLDRLDVLMAVTDGLPDLMRKAVAPIVAHDEDNHAQLVEGLQKLSGAVERARETGWGA